jgi:hypothetical protein
MNRGVFSGGFWVVIVFLLLTAGIFFTYSGFLKDILSLGIMGMVLTLIGIYTFVAQFWIDVREWWLRIRRMRKR